jgi:hypothetical protein
VARQSVEILRLHGVAPRFDRITTAIITMVCRGCRMLFSS